MPNYLANRAFNNVADMQLFLLDDTDQDMIGPFYVASDSSEGFLVIWRKFSTKAVDNQSCWFANGPGRWIKILTGGGGGSVDVSKIGSEYWERSGEFTTLDEWIENSKNYSLINWFSEYPGNFVENSGA